MLKFVIAWNSLKMLRLPQKFSFYLKCIILSVSLMQALWRTLRNPAESISHVAYRVLGKFGGSNRKMLKESQKLHYVVTEVQGPSIKSEFTDCKASIQLPMEKVVAHLNYSWLMLL